MTASATSRVAPGENAGGFRELAASGLVHFMGVGGAGMCALAEAVARSGGQVSGCDTDPGDAVEPLERLGVPVARGHDPAHLEGAVALVVSSAVPDLHPEIERARDLGIPVFKRARALGEWVNAGRVVGVAGTHGKTTTTAMVTSILDHAGMEPTGFVGGRVEAWESHLRPGGSDLFVVEADEFDRSFHHLRPLVAIVTNLEADHLDVYGDLAGVEAAFRTYLRGVRDEGTIVVCADDSGASSLLAGAGARGRSYGFSAGSQLRGDRLEFGEWGVRFRVTEDGRKRAVLGVSLPGIHNARNALGAAAVARALEVDWDSIARGLAAFGGVARRFQLLGKVRGIEVVDDYAHHPTEVAAALEAARARSPGTRLIAVFQPHLYTRTRDFAEEFGRVLAEADGVWITEVYPAREEPIPGVDAALLARHVDHALAARGKGSGAVEVRLHSDLERLAADLADFLRSGDLCMTLGAGSIDRVAPELIQILREGAGEDHHAEDHHA